MYPVRKRNIQNLLHQDLSEIFLPLFESQSCWRDLRPGTERTADARFSGSLSDSPKVVEINGYYCDEKLCRRDLGSLVAFWASHAHFITVKNFMAGWLEQRYLISSSNAASTGFRNFDVRIWSRRHRA
jgi:hypothetical protein